MMKRGLLLALALLSGVVQAEIPLTARNGITSYFTPCFPLKSIASNGAETLTGVTSATTNFRISLIADNENQWTDFETSADIETIATIGTYVSPTNDTDVRFGECESGTGYYQIQFHNNHMDKSGATALVVEITDDGGSFGDQTLMIDQNRATLADLNGEMDQALTDYDGPTDAEMDAGFAALNDPSLAEIRDMVIDDQGAVSLGCALAAILARQAGDWSGTTSVTYQDATGTETRVVVDLSTADQRDGTITCPTY